MTSEMPTVALNTLRQLAVGVTLLAFFGASDCFAQGTSPVAYASEGMVSIVCDGVQADGSESLNVPLVAGTIITTGDDGTVTIQIAPGIAIQLQPGTQITLGEFVSDKAMNEEGEAIPEIGIRLASGSVLIQATTEGLAGASLVIESVRGNVISASAGTMVVSSTGTDPAASTVSIAAISGAKLAVATNGEQLPVAENSVVVLGPSGVTSTGLQEYPELADVAQISLLSPPAVATTSFAEEPTPTPTPPPLVASSAATPTPTPRSTPTPRPTATPTPTPTPTPRPTATPTPTPPPISP